MPSWRPRPAGGAYRAKDVAEHQSGYGQTAQEGEQATEPERLMRAEEHPRAEDDQYGGTEERQEQEPALAQHGRGGEAAVLAGVLCLPG